MSYGKMIAAAAFLTGAFFVIAAWGDYIIAQETVGDVTYTLTSPTEEDGRLMLTRDKEGDLGDNMEYTCWSEVTHIATGVPDECAVYPIFVAMDVDQEKFTYSSFGSGIANYNWRYSNEDWNDTRCKHMIDEFGVLSPDAPGISGTVTTDWVGNFYLSCYIEDADPGENELTPGYYVVKKYHPNFPGFCSFGIHKKFQNYHFNDAYGCRLNVSNDGNHMALASVASCHPWGINQQTTWATFNHGGSIWSDPVLIPGYEGGRREYEDSPVGAVYDDGTAGYFVCKRGPYYPCEGGSGSHEYFKKVDFWGSMYGFAYGNENYWYNPIYPEHDLDERTYTPYIHDIAASPYPDSDGYIYFACTHFPNKMPRTDNLTIFKWNPHTPNIEPDILKHKEGHDKAFPQIDIYEAPDGKVFFVWVSCPIDKYQPWHEYVEIKMAIFLHDPATDSFEPLFGEEGIDVLPIIEGEPGVYYFCPNLATSKPVPGVSPAPDTGNFDIHTLSSKGDLRMGWAEGYTCCVESWSDVLYREFTLSWEPAE